MRRLVVVAAITAGLVTLPGATAGAGDDGLAAPEGVRVVNLNLLHGVLCPAGTESCQAPDRVELLLRQLEESNCPEIVGLQEIGNVLAKLLTEEVPSICDGQYEQVFTKKPRSSDTERVLTTLDVRSSKIVPLAGNFRTASRVVLDSPLGRIVLVVTHQDGDPSGGPSPVPCDDCPPPCTEAGAPEAACQTIVSADLADRVGGRGAIRILMGDFNVTATAARYLNLIADGWLDTHLEAGNPECDPTTATACTAGRDDKSVPSLTDPSKRQVERIDFIFVKAPAACSLSIDDGTDADGDGVGTGIWNGEPTVDGPGGIVWTSDHTGTSADISCGSD